MSYTELQVTTNFSFLRGGSHPHELVQEAVNLGYKEIAITDHNTLAGVVRAYREARKHDIRIIIGCCLNLLDGPSLLAYPTDKESYARLSALLTYGNKDAPKGVCYLHKADIYQYSKGIKFIAVPPLHLDSSFEIDQGFKTALQEYKQFLGNDLYLGASRSYHANDSKRLYRLAQLSQQTGVPMVATNDVHYHVRERRELQDVLTCVREKCTIYNAGFRLYQNAERHLKSEKEMQRVFVKYPEAINRTQEIVEACKFSLSELKYVYPEEITSKDRTPQRELTFETWKGAHKKYPDGIPEKIKENILFELKFIKKRNYASYFLTVFDLVRYARENKILCQGRGSAANSTVCYCLGVTSVDPNEINLLFARFMSDARDEPPDIDVDFEHERREEVIQYIYEKYGRHRAAIVATVTEVHFKGAVRDVGKAMGLSVDAINHLASSSWEFTDDWYDGKHATSEGFSSKDQHLIKVLDLTRQYMGFPRQLGQHTGGFVITQGKISDLCPVLNARMENRTCIEWNKDDIEALGFLKVDVLALGMLTCIRKAFDLLEAHHGRIETLASIPQRKEEEKKVYEMISAADTIGVFQIESRAQMSMLPRLRPEKFYDLVIEVAIVRPGPIQGDMVHPYLKRRNKEEDVEYPSDELEKILSRTLGVPLFQEQAMEIAIVAAGFTHAEADELRRSMATFKAKGKVTDFKKKLIDGMVAKNYDEEFAKRVFRQLEGFGSYGFPESHAASFALLVYVSSWIKCYFPDVFATALLNSMPMGFYQPAQIVSDAKKHHVVIKPVDINFSDWDNTLEEKNGDHCPIRLSFRQVSGLKEEEMKLLVFARNKPFANIHSLLNAGISLSALERLANADAFRSIGLDRRQALWEVSALADNPTGIYTGQSAQPLVEQNIQLPKMSLSEHVVQDYSSMSLSLKAHPLSFIRNKLAQYHVTPNADLIKLNDGDHVRVAGLVLVRQRPGTASGICFITIEDETGVANLVVFLKLFDKYRKEIIQSRILMVEGKLQIEGKKDANGKWIPGMVVIHVVVERCYNASGLLQELATTEDTDVVMTLSRADENGTEIIEFEQQDKRVQKVVQAEIFPGGRNFR